jgi:hypothetical protein
MARQAKVKVTAADAEIEDKLAAAKTFEDVRLAAQSVASEKRTPAMELAIFRALSRLLRE